NPAELYRLDSAGRHRVGMHSTGHGGHRFRRTRRRGHMMALVVAVGAIACHSAARAPSTAVAPRPVLLEVSASPDSTLKLASFALKEIDGELRLMQYSPNAVITSIQYFTNGRTGPIEIVVVTAVARHVTDALRPRTAVEV